MRMMVEEENSIVFIPKSRKYGVPIADGGSWNGAFVLLIALSATSAALAIAYLVIKKRRRNKAAR